MACNRMGCSAQYPCNRCYRRRQREEERNRNRLAADYRASRNSGGSRDGDRWPADDGTTHTVNSTSDPQVPGGYYHSQTDKDGNKATAVFNEDGSLADVKANKDWWDA